MPSATKNDITALRQDLRELKFSLIWWMIGIRIGYGALIIAALSLV